MSSTTKVLNILNELTLSSKLIIPKTNYFIIKLECSNVFTVELVEKLLNLKIDGVAPVFGFLYSVRSVNAVTSAGYSATQCVMLCFSSVGEAQHHIFNGDHHRIISFYVSHIALEYNFSTSCSIIDVGSRTKVVAYFHGYVFENLFKKISNSQSDETLEQAIEKFGKEKFDNLPPNEKYGIFIKKGVKKSEEINYTKLDEHLKFFFE